MRQELFIIPSVDLLRPLVGAIDEGARHTPQFDSVLFPAKISVEEVKIPGTGLAYLQAFGSRQIPERVYPTGDFYEFLSTERGRLEMHRALSEGRLPDGLVPETFSEALMGVPLSNGLVVSSAELAANPPRTEATFLRRNPSEDWLAIDCRTSGAGDYHLHARHSREYPPGALRLQNLPRNLPRGTRNIQTDVVALGLPDQQRLWCTIACFGETSGTPLAGPEELLLYSPDSPVPEPNPHLSYYNRGKPVQFAETVRALADLARLAENGAYRNPLDCVVFG